MHRSQIVVALLSYLAVHSTAAIAQTPNLPTLPDIPSPEEESLPVQDAIPETTPEATQEVPLEIDQPPAEDTTDILNLDVCPSLADTSEISFQANSIEVIGNTVLDAQIAEQVDCYLGKEIRLSDLFNLRSRITKLYLDAGYLTSGAFIPNNQDLTNGTVQVQVVEGEIEELQINGLRRLRQGYVRDRLQRAVATPLNQRDLERGLQLLQLDPVLSRVNAELTAGNGPGKSLLILDLEEADTFALSLSADNYRSPSIGSEGGNIGLSISHPLGLGTTWRSAMALLKGLTCTISATQFRSMPRMAPFGLEPATATVRLFRIPFVMWVFAVKQQR